MLYKKLSKDEYIRFVDKLAGAERVLAPQVKENKTAFDVLSGYAGLVPASAYLPTLLPPKAFLFPGKERLFSFELGTKARLEVSLEAESQVLLEVRPCDVQGISRLDRFFADDFLDEHYIRRRKVTTVVGMDCERYCDEYAFCESVGSLRVEQGFDLFLTDMGEYFLVRIGSNQGAGLLDKYARVQEVSEDEVQAYLRHQARKLHRFPKRLKPELPGIPLLLTGTYDSPLWEELGEKDLACGACNVTCPTCTCFDVLDRLELSLAGGVRERRWDGCMLEEFALVASGENFRKNRSQRVRHRIYRKFKYQMQRYGEPFCVGCGRCSRSCLVGIRPDEVLNELYSRSLEEATR